MINYKSNKSSADLANLFEASLKKEASGVSKMNEFELGVNKVLKASQIFDEGGYKKSASNLISLLEKIVK